MEIFGYMRRSMKTQLNINPLVTSHQSARIRDHIFNDDRYYKFPNSDFFVAPIKSP